MDSLCLHMETIATLSKKMSAPGNGGWQLQMGLPKLPAGTSDAKTSQI